MLLAKIVDHLQKSLIRLHFVFIHIDSLNVFTEFNRTVNLNFLVSRSTFRTYLLCHRGVKSSLQLPIIHLWQNLETILKSSNRRVSVTRVFVCESTTLSNVFLQKEVRLSVSTANTDSFRVICKVDHSILNPFKVSCLAVFLIEHPILPTNAWRSTERSWAFVGLKLASVVGVFDEKLHMFGDMNVDDDGCIIFDVKLQVVEIFKSKSKFFDPLLKSFLHRVMFLFRSFIHMPHGFHLKRSHPGLLIKDKPFYSFTSAFSRVGSSFGWQHLLATMDTFL